MPKKHRPPQKKSFHFELPIFIGLSILFLVAGYLLLITPFFQVFSSQFSLSAGDRYYRRVRLWYFYAQSGDWNRAILLEKQIDPADISLYRQANYPLEIKKRLNSLIAKTNKTIDDYLELAKIQISLGKKSDAAITLAQAHQLDPIRSDLEKLYYRLNSGD